jgi:hypothetical protein
MKSNKIEIFMRFVSCFLLLVTLISCNSSSRKDSPKEPITEDRKPAYSKQKFPLIDSSAISKVVLYIADTTVLNPPEKINVFNASIGYAPSLLDSSGKPCVKPSQVIQITKAQKDSLVSIFNDYLQVPQDSTLGTNCEIFYTHVFVLYDRKGKITEQIHLCLGCSKLNYIHRGAFLQFLDDQKLLFSALLRNMRKVNAYLPPGR